MPEAAQNCALDHAVGAVGCGINMIALQKKPRSLAGFLRYFFILQLFAEIETRCQLVDCNVIPPGTIGAD